MGGYFFTSKHFKAMQEIIFKAIPACERSPEMYSIHFVLIDGLIPIMAQFNPQGWCYLGGVPASEPPNVIAGKGVSHWLERQTESNETGYTEKELNCKSGCSCPCGRCDK